MNSRTKMLEAAEHFNRQRRTAKQRGISWELDFWQWLRIWDESGHLEQRGRKAGCFQMCRNGDVGPYASSTVRIDTMEANIAEAKACRKAAYASKGIPGLATSPST